MLTAIPDMTAALVTLEREGDNIAASLRETDDIAPLTRAEIAAGLRALANDLDEQNRQAGD